MAFLSQADQKRTKHKRCWITNAEVRAHLPEPAGNALPKAAQESAGHKSALLAHVQLVQEHPSSLQRCFPVSELPICAATFIICAPAYVQVQDFALLSAELHQSPVHSFLHTGETLLNCDTIIWCTNPNIICKLAEGVLCPIIQVINKAVKQYWPQHCPSHPLPDPTPDCFSLCKSTPACLGISLYFS